MVDLQTYSLRRHSTVGSWQITFASTIRCMIVFKVNDWAFPLYISSHLAYVGEQSSLFKRTGKLSVSPLHDEVPFYHKLYPLYLLFPISLPLGQQLQYFFLCQQDRRYTANSGVFSTVVFVMLVEYGERIPSVTRRLEIRYWDLGFILRKKLRAWIDMFYACPQNICLVVRCCPRQCLEARSR